MSNEFKYLLEKKRLMTISKNECFSVNTEVTFVNYREVFSTCQLQILKNKKTFS